MTGVNLGTCHWGHVGNGQSKPCPEAAIQRFESGLAYCARHARMVQDNRDWLLSRPVNLPNQKLG